MENAFQSIIRYNEISWKTLFNNETEIEMKSQDIVEVVDFTNSVDHLVESILHAYLKSIPDGIVYYFNFYYKQLKKNNHAERVHVVFCDDYVQTMASLAKIALLAESEDQPIFIIMDPIDAFRSIDAYESLRVGKGLAIEKMVYPMLKRLAKDIGAVVLAVQLVPMYAGMHSNKHLAPKRWSEMVNKRLIVSGTTVA